MQPGFVFLKAVVAGFFVAVPIGAVGALCMRRALQGRSVMGLITGLGGATADALLAAAAMYGLTLVNRYLIDNPGPVRLVGGVFLLALGIQIFRNRDVVYGDSDENDGAYLQRLRELTGSFSSGFALTIFNPATFFAFLGVFAGLGLLAERDGTLVLDGLIIGGAFIGSLLWWLTLTGVSAAIRHRIPHRILSVLNAGLGLILAGLGIVTLILFLGTLTAPPDDGDHGRAAPVGGVAIEGGRPGAEGTASPPARTASVEIVHPEPGQLAETFGQPEVGTAPALLVRKR